MIPTNKVAPQLTVRFPGRSLADLVEMFHRDVIEGGMVVRTRWGRLPLRVGSVVRLRFELEQGEEVLAGNAQIAAIRDEDRQGVTALALRFRGLTRAGQRLYAALLERSRGREALRPKFSGADFRVDGAPRPSPPRASSERAAPSRRVRITPARAPLPSARPRPVRDDDTTVRIDIDPSFMASL